MDPLQFLSIILLIVLVLEVTYLVLGSPRRMPTRTQARPVLLDTSVLIDGRIVPVAKTGFIGGTLIIPRSVLGELQFLADTGDHDKRTRARFGLDVVTELQAMPETDVQILQDGSKAEEGVDDRLLYLAKKHGAAICTIDYNLNKVALVEGILVLNINELAQSLRMAYLPGEKMHLDLVQKGQDSHQAVGYLPDGTMVVVEHANKLIGKTAEVEIIRSLQTAAGRMMFAKRIDQGIKDEKIGAVKAQTIQSGSADMSPRRNQHIKGKQPRQEMTNRRNPRTQAQKSQSGRRGKGSQDVESSLIELVESS